MAVAAVTAVACVKSPSSSPAPPLKVCSSSSLLKLPCMLSLRALSMLGMTARSSTRTSNDPAILLGD